jgi:hypothetical protein
MMIFEESDRGRDGRLATQPRSALQVSRRIDSTGVSGRRRSARADASKLSEKERLLSIQDVQRHRPVRTQRNGMSTTKKPYVQP